MSASVQLGFLHAAHFACHYFLLVFPTAVIAIEREWGLDYGMALALGTPAYVCFALATFPAGWLGDRWDGERLMALFFLGCGAAKRNQFLLINPRRQVITKTDLAKVECCFDLEPDVACKGAEKAFVSIAERISMEWSDESRRAIYGDDWFKSAVARVILFRAAEASVSKAAWYEGGYRAQIVAYTCARLPKLAFDQEGGGGLDYIKVWAQQSAGDVLEQQIAKISEVMARVLQNPPLAGQNISEWAKQQACHKTALETAVPIVKSFADWVVTGDEKRASKRQQRATGMIDSGLESIKQVLARDSTYWESLRGFCRAKRILLPDDEKALFPACQIPSMVPTDRQAARLLQLVDRAMAVGWESR